jgi:galactokinase
MESRWDEDGLRKMTETFQEHFPEHAPSLLSRAPGRVNLIGEHTDYNGLPVLPMALRQEIRLLLAPRQDHRVHVTNVEEEFGRREFAISSNITPSPAGDWANYLKAPCQALARRFRTGGDTAGSTRELRGFDAVVSSTLPVASGLSSSSALVIAVGRALMAVNAVDLPTLDFAEKMARAERYTGTQGGGMDQAISAGAREGHASRIEFHPLRMFETPVPSDWAFVVAHSLVRAEKSGKAREAYNLRTRECKEALALVAAALGPDGNGLEEAPITPAEPLTYPRLLELMCNEDLLDLAKRSLQRDLLRRFRHVVTEGSRVYNAEHALRRKDLLTFGLLMNSSHVSLRDDYEVSSQELDRLVELALAGGAAGARLTGAGFGGCIVALAERYRAQEVLDALEEGYYRGRIPPASLGQVLFLAEPAGGASVHHV